MKCSLIPRATEANIILRMGSLSNAQYNTFHWYFKKRFVLHFFERRHCFLTSGSHWFYPMEAVGEHVIVFIYFPKEIVTQCILLWISHIRYRTPLGFILFFSFCNLQTGFPFWLKLVLTIPGRRSDETRGNLRALFHQSRVGVCTAIPARPQVPASRFSS